MDLRTWGLQDWDGGMKADALAGECRVSLGAPPGAAATGDWPDHAAATAPEAAVRTAIEQAGAAVQFLPPSSPDFNPIELAFAKLKTFFRTARPRTFEEICRLFATALGLSTPTACAGDVRHCGDSAATRS